MIACSCRVCASGDSRDKRLRTSVMVEDDNGTNIVIDSGPDFRQQLLRENVKRLDAVVFTHGHKDHTAGLDDVRAFNFHQQRAMDVYADLKTQENLRREFAYVFGERNYPGIPELVLHTIRPNEAFFVNGMELHPVEAMHFKLPVLGFRIKGFSYVTDANFLPDHTKEQVKGSRVLVLNALRREKHVSHFTLSEAIKLAEELKADQTYFTHFSHQIGLHAELQKELPPHIQPAYDGLQVDL